jgi:hypothetical protein
MADENPQCDCRKHESRAKILSLDGQEIATGGLRIRDGAGQSRFAPDAEFQTPQRLDTTSRPEVVADLGTHQHRLLNWKFCTGTPHGSHNLEYNPYHFHFDVAS